ncbi:MAG TPA: MFS transporter [Xanthobacteraceae bacterium]|jgi:predicted MFS family arabinose efflux permease|nr:MFS transporter [Xanthobacteraceae bacterium]
MDDTTALAHTAAPTEPQQRTLTHRLLLFFALVYVVEGLGQIGGLVAQPLNYYLKEAQSFTPLQITAFITLFNVPWIIKPVYGLVSDFIPLFGYRRKSYLVIANLAAIAGYLWTATLDTPSQLLLALMITAYAMAISSTLCGAVLVENGHALHESGTFVNQQWLWLNIATMVAAVLGGQLVERLTPSGALHAAALIVSVAPLAVVVASLTLIPEKKTTINLTGFKATLAGLTTSFKRRELWIVAGFMFLYYFSPGLSTPLYFHMTDELKYSQAYIGILGSISAGGWVVGALLYRNFLSDMPLRRLLYLSIATGTVTTLAYLLLGNEVSAAVIYFCSGFSGMLATVSTLTLAADYSPPRAEGFTFAVLMSLINFANSTADNIGSFLYEHVFTHRLPPLVMISAAVTAFAYVLVPLLRLGDKRQGEPAAVMK